MSGRILENRKCSFCPSVKMHFLPLLGLRGAFSLPVTNVLCLHPQAAPDCSLVVPPPWGPQFGENQRQIWVLDDPPALWGCSGREGLTKSLSMFLQVQVPAGRKLICCGWLILRPQRWDWGEILSESCFQWLLYGEEGGLLATAVVFPRALQVAKQRLWIPCGQ